MPSLNYVFCFSAQLLYLYTPCPKMLQSSPVKCQSRYVDRIKHCTETIINWANPKFLTNRHPIAGHKVACFNSLDNIDWFAI